jgi:hypothetical protein
MGGAPSLLIGVEEGGVSFVNEEVASIAGLKVA